MKVPEGLLDPKSYYIGYEDGKKVSQTKPLSDEEILEEMKSLPSTIAMEDEDYFKFARAIEAKVRGDR